MNRIRDGGADVSRDEASKTLRVARELAHLATSVAAEAANLARLHEHAGAARVSIVASSAALQAAQLSFAIDALAGTGKGLNAQETEHALALTRSALDAASSAIVAARQALDGSDSASPGVAAP